MSVATLSAITRLSPRWLEAIERNDRSAFPPGPYVRGAVRAYAGEVRLDPDDTAREYLAQFPPPEAVLDAPVAAVPLDGPSHSFVAPAIVALCVVLALAGWSGWHPGTRGASEAGAVGTSGRSDALAPAVATTVRPPQPAGDASRLTVTLILDEPAWVTATADGKRVLFRILAPGSRETLRGDRELVLRVGNAGAVRWMIGGREAGRMGSAGTVRSVTVTPANAATIR